MRYVFVCLLVLTSQTAEAQWWSFENRSYYDPLIAGVREPHLSALFPATATRMSFMVDKRNPRIVWDIDVGAEIPIFGRESALTANDLGVGEWGVGLWIPIDFHMIEDFIDESGPIINTDYRFGAMVKFRRGVAENRWIAARLHFGHESTHLGDEFSIRGQEAFPDDFERINVSWEYLDLGGMYQWHAGQQIWNARVGVTSTFPFGDSYYQTGPGTITVSAQGPVTESTNWWDPYLGVEFL